MPFRVTMLDLETRCRRRVDMKKNQARNPTDFRATISERFGELWCLVSETGLRYFETSTTFTATGAATYSEPVDHLGTVRLARVLPDGREIPMQELASEEEWAFKGRTGDACYFTLIDDALYLYPTPSSGTYKLYYIPQPPDISSYADADVVDVVNPLGLAFMVWGVAMTIHGELEGNPSLAAQMTLKYEQRVMEWAAMRAFNEPRHTAPDQWRPAMWRDGKWWP
jgi:hypothetical protein